MCNCATKCVGFRGFAHVFHLPFNLIFSRFRSKAAQVQSRIKALDKIEKIELPKKRQVVKFEFRAGGCETSATYARLADHIRRASTLFVVQRRPGRLRYDPGFGRLHGI
jgi:hypothetical protein